MADINEPRLVPPDELHLYIEEQFARIRQLNADAQSKIQAMTIAPKLFHVEVWKVVIAGVAAVGLFSGALGYKIGATPPPPPAPIIIQLPK